MSKKTEIKRFDLCAAERVIAKERLSRAKREIADEVARYALERLGLPLTNVRIVVGKDGNPVAIEVDVQSEGPAPAPVEATPPPELKVLAPEPVTATA